MMSTNWRDKYLSALDEQETQQRRYQNQINKLQENISVLARACETVDPDLDEIFKKIISRSSGPIKADSLATVAQKVISRRATRESVTKEAFDNLVSSLISLNPESSTKQKIQKFGKQLNQRAKNIHAYPQLLREISELHSNTLSDIIESRPTWWQKILGTKAKIKEEVTPQNNNQEKPTEAPLDKKSPNETPKESESEIIEGEFSVIEEPKINPQHDEIVDTDEEISDLKRKETDDFVEEKYRKIEKKIEDNNSPASKEFTSIEQKVVKILDEMITSVEIEDCVREKFIATKQRLDHGLNWFEVVVVLEDVRDLFLQALATTNKEFEEYLNWVDVELKKLADLYSRKNKIKAEQIKDLQHCKNNLNDGLNKLKSDINEIDTLELLKNSVNEGLDELAQQFNTFDVFVESQVDENYEGELLKQLELLAEENNKIKQELELHKYRSLHDPLTGLPNRESYNQKIYLEYERWKSTKQPLMICVCDIDHFKKFNDSYGHQTGDRVLKVVATILKKALGNLGLVCRYGGEEFVLIMVNIEISLAEKAIDNARQKIATTAFRFKKEPITVTASFGICAFKGESTIAEVFENADKALYKAKDAGRNCVITHSELVER
ncbi:GGDEF domain-containing protein [Sessilibacter sp. MAH4]